ncbi:MAG: hypothetical protein WC565_02170 [Parcubacteria group bacterium]
MFLISSFNLPDIVYLIAGAIIVFMTFVIVQLRSARKQLRADYEAIYTRTMEINKILEEAVKKSLRLICDDLITRMNAKLQESRCELRYQIDYYGLDGLETNPLGEMELTLFDDLHKFSPGGVTLVSVDKYFNFFWDGEKHLGYSLCFRESMDKLLAHLCLRIKSQIYVMKSDVRFEPAPNDFEAGTLSLEDDDPPIKTTPRKKGNLLHRLWFWLFSRELKKHSDWFDRRIEKTRP